jgi:hypothetical protein
VVVGVAEVLIVTRNTFVVPAQAGTQLFVA